MKDDGGDDACRNGEDCAPSPVRENPKGNYHQRSQYREFDRDPGHGHLSRRDLPLGIRLYECPRDQQARQPAMLSVTRL
jgi:hypothetical protein